MTVISRCVSGLVVLTMVISRCVLDVHYKASTLHSLHTVYCTQHITHYRNAGHCTVHNTVHTTHYNKLYMLCTAYFTEHNILQITHFATYNPLHTTLHTTHCTGHTKSYTQHNKHCTLYGTLAVNCSVYPHILQFLAWLLVKEKNGKD